MAPEYIQKVSEKSDQGGPGEAKIRPRGAPQRFRKPGRRKDTLERERDQQLAPKWEPKFESVWYVWCCFSMYFRIIWGIDFHLIFHWFCDPV